MRTARLGRAGRAVAAAAVTLAVATACTSAVQPRDRHTVSSPLPTPPVSSHSPLPTTAAPSTTAPTTATAPATSPSRTHRPTRTHTVPPPSTSAPAPTTTAPPPPVSNCRHLAVRLIRGGAAQGTEIAALQFTNTGASGCTLGGYAQVVLLRHDRAIGSPSQPGGPLPGRAVPVGPGQTVQSLLRDFSTCQAPLSDNARVTVPGETLTVVRPANFRACTLRVGQLGPPS